MKAIVSIDASSTAIFHLSTFWRPILPRHIVWIFIAAASLLPCTNNGTTVVK